MFDSKSKFIKDINESFERFGINAETSEKGAVMDAVRLHMKDTMHNSSYVAIAKPKSEKGSAEKVWKDILKKDFIPAVTDPKNKGDMPAAALIVPEADIDIVEKILASQGASPSVYQIFPGYIVAGLKRGDVETLIGNYEKHHSKDGGQNGPEGEHNSRQPAESVKKYGGAGIREETGAGAAGNDVSGNGLDSPDDGYAVEVGDRAGTSKKMSLKAKLAAAALLGVAAGFVPFALKNAGEKNDVLPSQEQVFEEKSGKEPSYNVDKYFNSLKEGNPADMELLKSVASNPALSREYLDKLADSPVGVEAVKNPSVSPEIVNHAALSADESKRAAAAENPEMRREDLFRMAYDKSPKVRASLARNPAISRDVMEKLAKDPDPSVREALLENMQLPPDILESVSKQEPQPDCDFVRKMMSNPCITPEVLRNNASNPDACFRAGVASNPNTPPEVLDGMIWDKDPEVMSRAFGNPNLKGAKLNDIFPEGWTGKDVPERMDQARKAALANPNLRIPVMREALTADPGKYGESLAKNPALPSGIADELGRMAGGRKGLRNFINDAGQLGTDKNFHRELKNESSKYNGDISIPLRKTLNTMFADSVYDPDRLASLIRSKSTLKGRGGDFGGIGGNGQDSHGKISSLDKNGNAPIFFSKTSLPSSAEGLPGGVGTVGGGGKGGGNSKGSAAGEDNDDGQAALRAADDIVSDLMANVLPPVAVSVYGSFSPKGRLDEASGYGLSSPWKALNNETNGMYFRPQPMDVIFKNSCDRIDAMQGLF